MTKSYRRTISQSQNTPRGLLTNLDIELTERCNNNCLHCYINLPANDDQARSREMSYEEITNILQQAADLGCLNVRFTGGEPLLRPDFARIYEFTRKLGLRVTLFTNARLITTELAQLFAHIPPLEKIEVTVYGMHEDSYDTNAQHPGAFKSFWKGVQLLLEYQIPFVVKSVILPANRHEITEFEEWARTIPGNNKQPAYSMFLDLRGRRDDSAKNQLIQSLRISPQESVSFLVDHFEEFNNQKDQHGKAMPGLPGDKLFMCSAGDSQLSIDAYGRIQACLLLRSQELSIPKGTPLIQALEQFKQLKTMTSTNSEYLERCGKCFLKNLCENCPAKSWAETGRLDQPVQYYCEIAHATARHFGWLSEDEVAWEVEDWRKRVKTKGKED